MNDRKEKSNLKSLITFIIVMIIIFIVGVLSGAIIEKIKKDGVTENIFSALQTFFYNFAPFIYVIVSCFFLGTITILYLVCKNEYKQLKKDMDNDLLWNQLENHMNIPMLLVNILTICNVFAFGIILTYFADFKIFMNLFALVMSFVSEIAFICYTNSFVKMEKILNPEKKGNILDFNFTKRWIESSGEAEKLVTYQSGYWAFQVTNISCAMLWAVTFVAMTVFRTGTFAYVSICIIWAMNIGAYSIRASKLEKQ